nr:hypothetical protein BaRGS_029225 [Batillaria attramentaria]
MANSLVRYRCMVQDMFDPELYLAQYQVTNVKTGTVTMRSGRYKDIAECGVYEEDGDLKVNDVLEVVGVLSVDPAMVQFDQEEEGYARADVMPLGKLALNLSGPLAAAGLAPLVHQLIASLTTEKENPSSL